MKLVVLHTSCWARLAMRLPRWLCSVEHCRVGTDTLSYCVIDLTFI